MALTDEQQERLREILDHLEPIAGNLNGSSSQFVQDQVKRFEQYGANTHVSPKQWAWLEDLYDKNGGVPGGKADPHDDASPKQDDDIDDEIKF